MTEFSNLELDKFAKNHGVTEVRSLLSTESLGANMNGPVGGAHRIALTTMEGLAQTPAGVANAVKYNIEHPVEMLKVVGGSAALAAVLKVVLPEAGPVGRIAGVAMGAMFLSDAAPGFINAYKTGLNAQTWQEMHLSGKQWGDSAGRLGVNSALGYVGFKLGSGAANHLLSSKGMEGFGDAKQRFWDASANKVSQLLYLNESTASAASTRLLLAEPQSATRSQLQKQDGGGTAVTTKLAEEVAPLADGKTQVSTFKTLTKDTPPKPSAMDFSYEIQPQRLNYDANGPTARVWNYAKDKVFQLEWIDPKNPKESVLGTAFPVETTIDGRAVKAIVSANHNVSRSLGGTVGEFHAKLPDGSTAQLRLKRIDTGADVSILDFANPRDWGKVEPIPLGWASELRNHNSGNPSSVYVLGYPQDAAGLRLTQGVVRNIDSNNFGASPAKANSGYLDLREPIARIASDMPNYPGLSGGPLLYEAPGGKISVGGVHTAGLIKLRDGYSTAVEHVRAMLASAELPGPKPGMAQQVFTRSSEVSTTVGFNAKTGEYSFSATPLYIPLNLGTAISRLSSSGS